VLVGAATFDITPGYPVDLIGYVRRAKAPRDLGAPLRLTSCVLRSEDTKVVLVAADLLALGVTYAEDIRQAVAQAVGCPKRNVLLSSSHRHAAPAPGMRWKLGIEFIDETTRAEETYQAWLPSAFVAAAVAADACAAPVRVSGGVGQVSGLAVNRRERTTDGRTVLGDQATRCYCCRAVSGSVSPSRARSLPARSRSSPTSRPRGSTSRRRPTC